MRAALILLMLCVPVVLSGCSASPVASGDPLDPAPPDFSVEAIVLAGDGVAQRSEAHLTSGRFMLFADGSMHYESLTEEQSGEGSGFRRTLDRRQVSDLWSQVQQLGLADPAHGDEMINFNLVSPPQDRVVHLLAITGGGGRWVFTRSTAEGEPTDPAITALIRHMADLAWVNESGDEGAIQRARRYDFGPDPYARYRDQ